MVHEEASKSHQVHGSLLQIQGKPHCKVGWCYPRTISSPSTDTLELSVGWEQWFAMPRATSGPNEEGTGMESDCTWENSLKCPTGSTTEGGISGNSVNERGSPPTAKCCLHTNTGQIPCLEGAVAGGLAKSVSTKGAALKAKGKAKHLDGLVRALHPNPMLGLRM